MTVAAYVDEEFSADIGTNTGWWEFTQWAQSIGSPALAQLAAEGFSEDLPSLLKEVQSNRAQGPVESTRQTLLKVLERGGEVLIINDGT